MTRFGNVVCNAFWGFWPKDSERYVNPRMEDELIVFKKKIKQRFENRQIKTNFQFPRLGTREHLQFTSEAAMDKGQAAPKQE